MAREIGRGVEAAMNPVETTAAIQAAVVIVMTAETAQRGTVAGGAVVESEVEMIEVVREAATAHVVMSVDTVVVAAIAVKMAEIDIVVGTATTGDAVLIGQEQTGLQQKSP